MKTQTKRRIKELITFFLIHLVLTIPFYVNSVYATPSNASIQPPSNASVEPPANESVPVGEGIEGIRSISVKGSDGIEGIVKPSDFIIFKANVFLSNDKITNEQVILGSGIKFNQCSSSISNGFDCTLRIPKTGTDSFETQPYTINLYRDDKTLADSSSGILIADNKAPKVALSISKKKFSSQDGISIDYDITDFACDKEACSGKCVGIKKIDFYALDGSFNQTVDVAQESCNVKSTVNIEPKKLADGQNSIFAKAFDRFGQASQEASVTFELDTSAPVILSNSLDISGSGMSLSTFSLHKVPAEVTVNISGDDLMPDSVSADLSSLNPQQGSSLRNAKAVCESIEENLSVCKWDIELAPATAGSKTIAVNASDFSGNKAGVVITKPLTLDDKGPVVQSLSTTTKSGDKVLAKASGNTVIAVFDESTGLSAGQVFLHIQSSKIRPTSCSRDTNWACVWENVDFSSSGKMSIDSDTTDVLLNPVSQRKTTEVTVDSNPPVLTGIDISPVGGLSQAFQNFFKIGDKIAVVANLTEENDVFAVADFSKFITDAANVTGSCQRIEENQHICTFETGSINLQSSDSITFTFSDNAGNELVVERQLKTFGLVNATVPDFWTNAVSCSPKTIDRSLGPLINQKVFCQVSLQPKSSNKSASKKLSTVFIGDADCTSGEEIVESFETFNTQTASTSPIIKITLKRDELQIDNASISCTLDIFSKVGTPGSITKNPEIENVKINLAFFNLPLGEVSEEVQQKINDAIDDANGIYKLISTLNKFIFYAKKICQIIRTLYNIIAVLYIIALALDITKTACHQTVILNAYGICTIMDSVSAVQCGNAEATSAAGDGSKKLLNKFCDYVNCKQTILWGPAVKNWINNAPTSIVSPGQNVGPKTEIQGSGFFGKTVEIKKGEQIKPFSRPVSEYMDPQHNLFAAALFACIPGIVYGLDKYRQILCLYADCLQNAVAKEGLPVTACEDQKAYARCKYITGELFALFPWTAVFDHFMGIIKNSLSNPFSAIGVAISLSLSCLPDCNNPLDAGVGYQLCKGARLFTLVADAAKSVEDIIDNGFTIRQDYCERLNQETNTTTNTPPEVTTSRKDTPTNINDTKKK